MNFKIVNTIDIFQELETKWNEIATIDNDLSYFSSFEYNYNWWKHNRTKSDKLHIILIYQQKNIIGIAPLYIAKIKHKVFAYNQLRFIGFGDTLNCLVDDRIVKKNRCFEKIFKVIENTWSEWDTIYLRNINSQTTFFQFLKKGKYHKDVIFCNEIPYFELTELKDSKMSNDVYPKSINNLKSNLKKYVNYQFKVFNGSDINQSLFEQIVGLYTQKQFSLEEKFNRKNRYNLFTDLRNKDFLQNLFKSGNDKIYIFVLETIEGKLISYNISYEKNNSLISWNTGYDTEFYKFRLNKIRMAHVLDFCVKNNFERYYWGAGGYNWKFEWTKYFIPIYELNFTNPQSPRRKKIALLRKVKIFLANLRKP